MIIDFHTHTFPDKIAAQTIEFLAQKGDVKPFHEGTLASLKESMKRSGVDFSVILPVATLPRQVESINRLAAELNGKDGIIYAGAIHPDCENIEEILDFVKNAGLFGIKLHPDYQDVFFSDPRVLRIISAAAKRGLYVVTHAGIDVGYKNDVHCTPDMVLEVLDKLGSAVYDKLILAHMGGCNLGEEVLEKLCGKPVYMDTAFVLDRYPETAEKIIRRHGADKILFATDSPWADQKRFIEILRGFDLTERERGQIFSENAKKILSSSKTNIR